MNLYITRLVPLMVTCAVGLAQPAYALVERFEVVNRASPAFEAGSFGSAGNYERIDGIAYLAIDPESARGKRIVDLDRAPQDADGKVRWTTEVSILRPISAGADNGTLLYDVPNRGRNLLFNLFNLADSTSIPDTVAQTGDGHLMAEGYTIVWSGWQTALADGLMQMSLPIMHDIKGLSREEIIFDEPGTVDTVQLSYPAENQDPELATLTVRLRPEDPRSTVAGLSFRYLSSTHIEITRPAELDAGAILEFIYPAKSSIPAGLAFAATSDVISWLRGSPGHEAEVLLEGVDHVLGVGISQSGRFLRDLIWQGFNTDESGARVLDGAIPHIAGSRKSFTNARFAQPGRYSREHEDHDFYGDQFPFSYAEIIDPLSGQTGSILSACEADGTCPKIMHTDTSTEFWQARAALISTSPSGEPLEMPDNVRLYFLSGAPHFKSWDATSVQTELCRFPTNPLSVAPVMRGLLRAMQAWVSEDRQPPASRFPSVADGTLVSLGDMRMPDPGMGVILPVYNELRVRDHSTVPPTAGPGYPILVPQLDEDGNPLGGVRDPSLAAPLGTSWGWNLRSDGFAGGGLCGLDGSFFPFAATSQDQDEKADSRIPIDARYVDEDAYAAALDTAVSELGREGLMLEKDRQIILDRGAAMFGEVTADR
jgi:hypothetical protein